jgi:hypothetical protein
MLKGFLPFHAPHRPALRTAQLAKPLGMGGNLTGRSADTFALRERPDRSSGCDAIAVHLAEHRVEPVGRLASFSSLSREAGEASPGPVELAPGSVTRLLQLDPSLELRDQAAQGIHLSITSVAAIPPRIPAASASRMTLVCIH